MDPYHIEQITTDVSAAIFTGPNAISNVGLIRTKQGMAIVDTTQSKQIMQAVLNKANIEAKDASLVINTHLHSDHIN